MMHGVIANHFEEPFRSWGKRGRGVVRAWSKRGNNKLFRGNAKLFRGKTILFRGPDTPQNHRQSIIFSKNPKKKTN